MKPRLFAMLLATGMAASVTGHAQSADLSQRERDELARAHFRAGSRYFELRRYADAASEFERVFELSGQTALLYNAGRAWEGAGRAREAVSAYERFLRGNTEGIDRAAIESSLTALRARVQQEEQAQAQANAANSTAATTCSEPTASANTSTPATPNNSTPVVPTTATAPSGPAPSGPLLGLQTRVRYEHNTPNMIGPWLCVGAGAVLGGMAIWQGLLSAADNARVTSATVWSPQLTSSYFSARDEGTTALVLTGIGSTAVVGGIVWFIARGQGERREEVMRSASVTVLPNQGGASVLVGGVM